MSTSAQTIRDRAAATLRLVATLERGGVLGPAPAAALRNSLGGVLVPMSATSSPDVERAELDELRAVRARAEAATHVQTNLPSLDAVAHHTARVILHGEDA